MAYSSTNPPHMIAPRVAGGYGLWVYVDEDSIATVAGSGYISNGHALGMKVGDGFHAVNISTASAYEGHGWGTVSAVTASSAATVVFVSSST
jgi:hypothetical protein